MLRSGIRFAIVASRLSLKRTCRVLRAGSAHNYTTAASSFWAHLKEAPLDGNHATAHAFDQDPSPLKVNLGRGVYKDDNGKSVVLKSVRKAEELILSQKQGHDYLPFNGLADFAKATAEFGFGQDSVALKDKRVATVQTISGTGALRVGAEFLSRFLPANVSRTIYISDPSYVNHVPVFRNAGFDVKYYRYYDTKSKTLDFKAFSNDLSNLPNNSVILFHACAHNPTGTDPTPDQWRTLSQIVKNKQHVAFFDAAYLAFSSGSAERDSASFRLFVADGHTPLVAQSYAKNFGLYGQRVGALNVVTNSAAETKLVMSNLNQVVRPMYSNPPAHGARIVATVFTTPELLQLWQKEVAEMADRLKWCREKLVQHLGDMGSRHSWRHISDQIGMFAYSGLTQKQVEKLRNWHVYMNLDGRMSISGINSKNVEYLAKAMHDATKDD